MSSIPLAGWKITLPAISSNRLRAVAQGDALQPRVDHVALRYLQVVTGNSEALFRAGRHGAFDLDGHLGLAAFLQHQINFRAHLRAVEVGPALVSISIAAISYYVVSLLLYGGKALKAAGVRINPEVAVGALIPLALLGIWSATRRIHNKLHGEA